MLDETYWAKKGWGSFLNGQALRVSTAASIRESVFSPNGLYLAEARPYLPALTDMMQRSWAVRSYGGALDACLLSAGKVDIWFEPKVEPWDLAALKLIIEEAGGAFFALDGTRSIHRGNAVACAPGVAAEVRAALGVPLPGDI
jgi:fructose-1,6-bisphosphatase/inositol monophosphatase family enzyme